MEYILLRQYKYELQKTEIIQTSLRNYMFKHRFFTLDVNGILTIFKGYKWDGISGPTLDTKNTMIPGLGHDALYQAIRLELLPLYAKITIDQFFYDQLIEHGVWKFRAKFFYQAVHHLGHNSCIPGDVKIPEVFIT